MKRNRGEDIHDDYIKPKSVFKEGAENTDECIDVNFPTTLTNITDSLNSVNVGDLLNIRLQGINVLVAYNTSEQVCGNIISPYNGTILSCLRKNRMFIARLLSKSGHVQVIGQ